MKFFTFFGEREDFPLVQKIRVIQCRSIVHSGQKTIASFGDDYYISIGNGDESNGRLFIKRSDISMVTNNTISCGEICERESSFMNLNYLKREKDVLDNRVFILFKNIEKIDSPFFFHKDDYLKIIQPNREVNVENLFGENFLITNSLQRRDGEIKIINNGNTFVIHN